MALDGEQLDRFHADGYLPLGAVMSAGELQSLNRRTDDLTTGRVPPGRVGFQLDNKWHHAGYDSTRRRWRRPAPRWCPARGPGSRSSTAAASVPG